MVHSTRRFVLCLNFVLFCSCFPVLLALRLPRLGKRELILVLFVRLFDLCLFGFIGFLFLLVSGKGLRFVIVALPGLFSYPFFTLYYFVLVFFSPFSIAITSLGEERVNLSAFRTFVRFALVWVCLFPLPLGVWEGLRFVIVALPGLFSYLFLVHVYKFRKKNMLAMTVALNFVKSFFDI